MRGSEREGREGMVAVNWVKSRGMKFRREVDDWVCWMSGRGRRILAGRQSEENFGRIEHFVVGECG